MGKVKYRYKQFHIQLVYEMYCEVMSKYIRKKAIINELFDDVIKRYSVKSRHYHEMNHLYNVASMWNAHKHLLKNPDEILMAVIYHDVVYNARRNDNEKKSANFFSNRVAPLMKISSEQIDFVCEAILATKHHQDSEFIYRDKKDILYLLDFDVEVLGTRHQSTYDWYKNGVRKEYKMYSDKEFYGGRRGVLLSFLNRKKLYFTKEFKKIEKRARKNLQNEINSYIC